MVTCSGRLLLHLFLSCSVAVCYFESRRDYCSFLCLLMAIGEPCLVRVEQLRLSGNDVDTFSSPKENELKLMTFPVSLKKGNSVARESYQLPMNVIKG
jgi:hypothetical protein